MLLIHSLCPCKKTLSCSFQSSHPVLVQITPPTPFTSLLSPRDSSSGMYTMSSFQVSRSAMAAAVSTPATSRKTILPLAAASSRRASTPSHSLSSRSISGGRSPLYRSVQVARGYSVSRKQLDVVASASQKRGHEVARKGQDDVRKPVEQIEEASVGPLRKLLGKAVGVLGSLVLFLNVAGDALSETITIMLPASPKPEVTRVQRTLVEAWSIVREAFVDPTYNSQDWDLMLTDKVRETLTADTADQAYDSIRAMLSTLDDPFTRIVTPKEYEAFRITSDGALQGVGLVLASDPDTGRLVVITPIEGGPADRAGIQSGDVLLEIDDQDLEGMGAQQAAELLRGQEGSAVTLKLMHQAPIISGTLSASSSTSEEVLTEVVELTRESISFSPVYATILPHSLPDGTKSATGYIRLASFSQNAAEDMQRAIEKLERQGATSFILDLRNNPGGLVKAGLDVAQMWLDGTSTLVNTVDRYGGIQTISSQDSSLHALTERPLAVLVNHNSASASEILAGALQDNGRATLIGEQTYGKGRIQSVFELSDGTALFVTVAKYLSPSLHEIDRVGVAPDLTCSIPGLVPSDPNPSTAEIEAPVSSEPGKLRQADMSPTSFLPSNGGRKGAPGMKTEEEKPRPFRSLVEEIQDDSCIVAAEKQLDTMAGKI